MKRSCEGTEQAIEDAVLDLFVVGTTEIEKEKENSPCLYIETKLTTMAKKEMTDEAFNHSIEHRMQLNLLLDASTPRALNSPHFMHPVANLEKLHMEKTVKGWRMPAKVEAVPPPKHSSPWLKLPFLRQSRVEKARKRTLPEPQQGSSFQGERLCERSNEPQSVPICQLRLGH